MSNIFGYFSRSGTPISLDIAGSPSSVAEKMMQAMADWQPDVARYSSPDTGIVLGSLLLYTTTESLNEILPYSDTDSGLTITADARIDNRDELSSILGLTDNAQTADSIYILRAYQKWGADCGKHLLGDYAFAIWDSRQRKLFCARDHIGARALFYYTDRDKFIFATEPKGILAPGEVPMQLTEDWIATILVGVYPAKDQAPFEQMKKLPPAHYLAVTPDKIELQQYWDLDVSREIHYKREQDYYDEMRTLMEQAIRRCTRSAFPVGAELSGGLDSSGISAFAHAELKKRNEELSVFSHVLPEWAEGKVYPFNDEKQFINSLCDYADITRKHFITAEGKGILDEFRLCTERFGYPTGYPFPIFCDALYEKAQAEGVRVLLSGFPGDELVTSQGAYFFYELLHSHHYLALWHELYARSGHKIFATSYSLAARLLQHHAPNLFRLFKGNSSPKANWLDNSFGCCVATDAYIAQMHLRDRLFDGTAEPVFHNVRERERFRISEKFVCHRIEQCSAHATYQHLDFRSPFADRNLVEYVLALPATVKVRNGVKRYPFRMAIKNMVPEDIRWRQDKSGTTIPTFQLRCLKDSTRIGDLLKTNDGTWPPYIDLAKMENTKQRIDHRQIKDQIYPYSFYSALML